MANCGQACPHNTLDGCKVKKYNAICPITNMAVPITEYRITNADRIRAMSDEELVKFIGHNSLCDQIQNNERNWCESQGVCNNCLVEWLKQPAEE